MSFRFGARSRSHLATCDLRLRDIAEFALAGYAPTVTPVDFAVIEGFRNQETQDDLFQQGLTQRKWPMGSHNRKPSAAIHFVPWHAVKPNIRWDDIRSFEVLATHILGAAAALEIPLLWGGHWKRLRDYAHYELIEG